LSQSAVFTSRCLVATSNGRHSPYSTIPVPQLPASNSNSSQRLTCSSPLTNSSPTDFTPLHSTELAPLTVLFITSWHGPHRKHRSCCCIHCCVRSHRSGPRRKHYFPVSQLAHDRNLLHSNGRYLQSHYLATCLHATVHNIKQSIFYYTVGSKPVRPCAIVMWRRFAVFASSVHRVLGRERSHSTENALTAKSESVFVSWLFSRSDVKRTNIPGPPLTRRTLTHVYYRHYPRAHVPLLHLLHIYMQ
jgi:hypothetical protein